MKRFYSILHNQRFGSGVVLYWGRRGLVDVSTAEELANALADGKRRPLFADVADGKFTFGKFRLLYG